MTRWRYCDPSLAWERNERSATLRAMADFWRAFEARRADLERARSADGSAWVSDALHAIDRRLTWEMGPAQGGGRLLAVTPETEPRLRPLVQCFLDQAPLLSGWTFLPARPPKSLEDSLLTVKTRVGPDAAGWRFVARPGAHRRIDVALFTRGGMVTGPKANAAAFVLLEALLGEAVLDRWIGAIDVAAGAGWKPWLRASAAMSRPIAELSQVVGEMREALLAKPVRRPESFHVVQMTPQEPPPYPARTDLLVAVVPSLEWFRALYWPGFYSERYAPDGHLFAYLKMAGVTDRRPVEDAVGEALGAVGEVIGGASGLEHAYVDLITPDPAAAWARVKDVVPTRSWLLFHDQDLAEEWLGDGNSPPPGCEY